MVEVIKKILCIWREGHINNKRVLTIARKEYDNVEKFIIYESLLKGNKEFKKKTINQTKFNQIMANPNVIKESKVL